MPGKTVTRRRNKAILKKSVEQKREFEAFRNNLLEKINSDPSTKHYSVYYGFDAGLTEEDVNTTIA